MALIVDINRVIPRRGRESVSTRKVKEVLEKQGQIEPLQVTQEGEYFVTFERDPWASNIVHGAVELGWLNLLVVVMDRYEE